ncbi:GPI-anchored adhesin protein [Trifolium repens]|nr:GPI-anchored adhesin protein [Trifolium repens]
MEKKRSKGSFFSLFDWNAKSRKKLVWNNPTSQPEVSRHGKENLETLPESQFNRIKVDENGASPSNIASGDFHCSLSICSDEGCGSKAPGLVARLMGLDSLPTSEVSELSGASLYSSNSHGASHYNEGALRSMDDFRRADYLNTPLKPEKSSWDAMESRAHKMENRQMKRFQTEMLPPKSAKPIPVTHNRLLSPIKSNGYLPQKNVVQIIEAAAKIIDGSPQPYMRNRILSGESSSVPLRILDLKERLEAAQYAPVSRKLVDSNNGNTSNCKPGERSSNLYRNTSSLKGSRDSEKRGSCHPTSKGKSGSMQTKNNVQSRDTLVSNGNRKYMKQKEQNETKSNQLTRNQKPITNRALPQKTSANRNSNVLVPNNQKQNSMTSKGKSASKTDFNKPTTRGSSSENSSGTRKATNKGATNVNVQPKRSSSRVADNRNEFPPSKAHSISQKKKYNSRGAHEVRSPDHVRNDFESKSIKCNFTTDGSIDQNAFNMNESNDVVSFTFTSPLRRSMPEDLGHSDNLQPKKLSLSPTHMIDSDVLSVLLEQKLQELTSRLNLPQCTLASEEPYTGLRSSFQDKASSKVNSTVKEQDEMFNDELNGIHNYRYGSSDGPVLNMNQQLQISEVREDTNCSSNNESGNDLGCQYSNTDTLFQAPSVSESYLDSEDSAYGSTIYSSMQDEEVSNISQINESELIENEVTWSEQSSSVSMGHNVAITQIIRTPNMVDLKRSSNMELEYVQNILNNAEFMAEEFVLGRTNTVIMPNLFDLLENQSTGTTYCGEEEYSKLERKVLFDFVSESLELKCEKAFVGSCKGWPRWVTSVQRKDMLAEELYKEMMSYRNMEEVMVDELVSNEMSSGYGKWLDFDIETFEEGLEVEEDILECLIDEFVSDLLVV